jgi:hypothetical protein
MIVKQIEAKFDCSSYSGEASDGVEWYDNLRDEFVTYIMKSITVSI